MQAARARPRAIIVHNIFYFLFIATLQLDVVIFLRLAFGMASALVLVPVCVSQLNAASSNDRSKSVWLLCYSMAACCHDYFRYFFSVLFVTLQNLVFRRCMCLSVYVP